MDKSGLFLEFNHFKPIFKTMLESGNSGLPAASNEIIYVAKKVPVKSPLKSNSFFDYNDYF